MVDRAIAQVVSSQIPISSHVGFVVDKVALGMISSEYFGFPCQFSFPQILHTHLTSGLVQRDPLLADVPRGISPNPPHENKKNPFHHQCHNQNMANKKLCPLKNVNLLPRN
jgi:hypothetical protein